MVATLHTSVPEDGIVFAINGQKHALDGTQLPSATLFDFLRSNSPLTGTKSARGEGGCGSCSVEVYRLDPASGRVRMRCINACLAPVATLDCCSVVTVEGLGDCSKGFHPVQERIAAFHGSQCGFCTPGMAVACHAAITMCHISGGGRQPSAAQMEKALDGNLCRCTGYRPILDASASFAKGVDMEDLGVRDEAAMSHGPNAPTDLPQDITMPAWLIQHIKEASGNSKRVTGAGQAWAAPRSLGQLMDILGQAKGQPRAERAPRHRIVAGNTGAGVYKDWPSGDDAMIVDITRVAEMRVLHRTKEGGLLIGAAVTQEELIDCLLSGRGGAKGGMHASCQHLPRDCPNGPLMQMPSCPNGQPEQTKPNRSGSGSLAGAVNWLLGRSSSAEVKSADKGDPAAVWTPLAKHLQRIAGNQVRAAATIGGNLVLTRRRGLESDLATLLMAVGAQVEGAFVFGLGMMLQESVTYTADGQPTYDSTWDYKIPSAACIPRRFNIGLLEDSPNKHGVMGSKSVGEPPLLLSTSALSAFAAAVAAAREDFSCCTAKSGNPAGHNPAAGGARSGDSVHDVSARSGGHAMSATSNDDVSAREAAVQELCAPVTVKAVRAAVGSLHLPNFLEQYA